MIKTKALVIGFGPCGIQAAIQLKRLGYDAIVIGYDYGALEYAKVIENYYGVAPVSGKKLVLMGLEQAQNLGVMIVHDEVLEITPIQNAFIIKTLKQEYQADAIFMAVGKARNKLTVAKDYEGRGISYCAACDGFFYRRKPIGLIGEGNYMRNELDILKNLTDYITIFTNGKELSAEVDSKFKVVTEKIESISGETRLESINTINNSYSLSGAFVALGHASSVSFASHLGLKMDKENNIVVDANYQTNFKGIFAGGDCIGGILQVSKAVGDGITAGNSIFKYLESIEK